MKFNVGIWPKPLISLIVKKNLEIGLNNKQKNIVGRDLRQNELCNCGNFQNGFIGPKDMRQKPNFGAWHLMAPKIYFIEKGGEIGLDWHYIGVGWRKVAEIG